MSEPCSISAAPHLALAAPLVAALDDGSWFWEHCGDATEGSFVLLERGREDIYYSFFETEGVVLASLAATINEGGIIDFYEGPLVRGRPQAANNAQDLRRHCKRSCNLTWVSLPAANVLS